jgi:hypothetical protein
MLMVIGIITVHSALNGVTMKETIAQKRERVSGPKEPELTPAPNLRSALPQRGSLSARYPVNGAWPAEMRIDMLAAYLDFRNVRELVLAVSRGEAPAPTRYRGVGRAREAIWVKAIVDEHVAPESRSGRIWQKSTWQRSHEAVENRFKIAPLLPPQAAEEWPLGIFL